MNIMYFIVKTSIISLVVLAHTVHGNDNNPVYNDNQNNNDINGNNIELSQSDKEAMDELLNSGIFKFLENLDDDAMLEGRDQYMGKANENTYCYVKDEDPYHLFSTKTRYPEHEDSPHMDPVPGCEIVYVWMIMRHGVRYGSWSKTHEYYLLGKIRDEIVKNAGTNKTELCVDDIFNLLLWMPILPNQKPIEPETLTQNGYELVKKMAKLLKEKFPHLIPDEYNPNIMKIEFSDEIKVNQTVEALTEQLFGKPFKPEINPDGVIDQVYQSNCRRPTAIDRETGHNFTHLTQKSDYVKKMVEEVSLRLGFDTPLTYRDLATMYDGCQYEIAWGQERSPWCAVFTKDHLKIMEYISDISYYYFCGPGDIYNYFQGCVLLKDLVEKLMTAAKNENSESKMDLYLGHSTTVLLLVTQLGLVDDPVLTHKNYFELADRKWRTSFLAPYTGNIMAILHRCSTGEKYRVKFLLNEKPFIFNEICDENNLCSLEKLYKLFEPIITSEECSTRYCNHTVEEMCKYLNYSEDECAMLRIKFDEMMSKKQSKTGKIEEEEEEIEKEKETVKSKEFVFLEKEYRHACILICISMVVIIGVFCKMSRLFPRIFRRTKKEKIKENGKTKSEENHKKGKEEKKTKSKEKSKEDLKTKANKKSEKEKPDDKKKI